MEDKIVQSTWKAKRQTLDLGFNFVLFILTSAALNWGGNVEKKQGDNLRKSNSGFKNSPNAQTEPTFSTFFLVAPRSFLDRRAKSASALWQWRIQKQASWIHYIGSSQSWFDSIKRNSSPPERIRASLRMTVNTQRSPKRVTWSLGSGRQRAKLNFHLYDWMEQKILLEHRQYDENITL